jgi:predicted ATPase/transcriptional regulator with XRE-family HTH domain
MESSFGYWVRRRRKALDLTQAALAEKALCSLALIRKLEMDERRPSLEVAQSLADALQIDPADRTLFLQVARGERAVERLATVATVAYQPPVQEAHAAPIDPFVTPTQSPLPIPPTPLIGRSGEVDEILGLLGQPECRLLTIVGPGGMGKSRLALAVAHQIFEDGCSRVASKGTGNGPWVKNGVYFIPLAPLQSPAQIVEAVAQAVDFPFSAAEEPQSQLLRYLRDKSLLLILDNLEHLLADVTWLNDLLQTAPGIKLLVTSRERIQLQSEWVFELQGLPIPPVPCASSAALVSSAERYSAVALFVACARRGQQAFVLSPENCAHVVQICQLVAGMPLGIELAAAWVHLLSCREIAGEIQRNLDFLVSNRRDVPARHRSLRATFDWSWQLLTPAEQRAWRQLSIFRGGFTRAAAQAVAGANLPLLSALVSKALVQRIGEDRYDLHELARQYAGEQLWAAGEHETVQRNHLAYFVYLAEAAEPHFHRADFLPWLTRIEQEQNNVRMALAWALEHDVEHGLRLLNGLCFFWYAMNGVETTRWLQQALQAVETTAVASTTRLPAAQGQARLLRNAALLRHFGLQGFAVAHKVLALAQAADDQESIAYAHCLLALDAWSTGNQAQMAWHYGESLRRFAALDDHAGIARVLQDQASVERYRGNFVHAVELMETALQHARTLGSPLLIAEFTAFLGRLLVHVGELRRAQTYLAESLQTARSLRTRNVEAWTLAYLGQVVGLRGDQAAAFAYLRQALALQRELGRSDIGSAELYVLMGQIAQVHGDTTTAEECFAAIDWHLAAKYAPWDCRLALLGWCRFAVAQNNLAWAQALLEQSEQITPPATDRWSLSLTCHAQGEVQWRLGNLAEAQALFQRALAAAHECGDQRSIAALLEALAALFAHQGEAVRATTFCAAADTLRTALGAPRLPIERPAYEVCLVAIRQQLDDNAFAAAWRRGEALTVEQAVAAALSE